MVDTNLLLRRVSVVRGCLQRLDSKRTLTRAEFLADADAQDVVLRNLQVAIQACMDAASHVVTDCGWELPGTTAGIFGVMARHGVIPAELSERLSRAVRLRNLLVHAYDSVSMERIHETLQGTDLDDLEQFCRALVTMYS
ncbi:MAG: DUF86 domain-containing protein [Candidatus Eremiobacterota bacterium]